MGVRFNHTIIRHGAAPGPAVFLAEILALPAVAQLGSMLQARVEGGARWHAAFLLCQAEFDQVLSYLQARGLPYWGDAGKRRVQEVYRRSGGRGLYCEDPDGQLLEIMTQPPQSCATETSP